ncbi:MAG: RecQ family ATP-dependent DNA helicase [Clostridia bacterium]|nr:RecQ family ATP-dependent DNA helicase [Clostridia bacterium]MBR2289017.1 RecQ family ATP-dependent DNA helicase [Clostridia bacterium]
MTKAEVLKTYFGFDAFRPGQEEIVDRIMEGQDVLGIMPTGGGKSLCFQVPALLLEGVTLVISPLISLMRDQVLALHAAGVSAAYINSSMTESEITFTAVRAMSGRYKLIYVAPERVFSKSFQQMLSRIHVAMVAIDEAHCVSQWGHAFRPEYGQLESFIRSLPERPRVCAFTATATEEVRRDIVELLGLKSPFVRVAGFDRPNLFFEVIEPQNRDDALLRICEHFRGQSGIVYAMTREQTRTICRMLERHGFAATLYHGGLESEAKERNQEDFQFDRKTIMVSTTAFGMGIDKANIRFVVHYSLPLSLETYYQEAGRAGRDGMEATCILLYSPKDIREGLRLIYHSYFPKDMPEHIKEYHLELDRQRLRHMDAFAKSTTCLRKGILTYFGDKAEETCQGCCVCMGKRFAFIPQVGDPPKIEEEAAGNAEKKVSVQALEKAQILLEALMWEREKMAEEEKVPSYIICTDAALYEMTQRKPADLEAMAAIQGMGKKRAKAYGSRFLLVIDALRAGGRRKRTPDSPWSAWEAELLQKMYREGCSLHEICDKLGRTTREVLRMIATQGK